MKRNLLILLLALAMVATMLASCGGNQECVHTFSENWDSNATQHWHPATCEHGEIKDGLADHVDENEDGVCDVCTFDKIGHDCTFAEEWISDEYYHWHEATCSHSEEKGTYELHSDNNFDSICDYCEGHVHAMNIIGSCSASDCGKQLKEPEDIENYDIAYAIYSTGITGYNKISDGTVEYEFTGRSNTSSSYTAHNIQNVTYIFGDSYTHTQSYNKSTNAGQTYESSMLGWYELDGEGGVFGLVSYDEGYTLEVASASTNHLYGYYFALSNFAGAHGAENILYTLFDLSQNPNARDFEYAFDADAGSASFSFGYLAVNVTSVGTNVNYYDVSVSFTFGEQYALTGVDINLDCYTNDPGSIEEDDDYILIEEDIDLDYNETTGEFVLRENALPDTYVIKVTQTVGEKDAVNPYPKGRFVPDSFDIFSDVECTQKIEGNVVIDVKTFFKIYLGNYQPEGTTIDKVNDYMRFEVLDEDGNVLISNVDCDRNSLMMNQDCSRINGYYSFDPETQSRYFVAYPKKAGVYTYVLYFVGEKSHEVTIYAGVQPQS